MSMDPDAPTQVGANSEAGTGDPPKRVSTTRRTVLKAGWIAPVIAMVSLPASSYVANGSGFDPNKD